MGRGDQIPPARAALCRPSSRRLDTIARRHARHRDQGAAPDLRGYEKAAAEASPDEHRSGSAARRDLRPVRAERHAQVDSDRHPRRADAEDRRHGADSRASTSTPAFSARRPISCLLHAGRTSRQAAAGRPSRARPWPRPFAAQADAYAPRARAALPLALVLPIFLAHPRVLGRHAATAPGCQGADPTNPKECFDNRPPPMP
jgi:hypothetical protein